MKKKVISLVLSVCMAMGMFAGCGGSAETTQDGATKAEAKEHDDISAELIDEMKNMVPDQDYSKYTIGFCGMTLNNEYHIILANAVAKAGKALGMKVEIQAGSEHQSVEDQLTIIENFISQGVDGIILVPAASEGLIAALQECKNANIPVINLDTKLDKKTLSTLGAEIPFYGTDNYAGGQLVGQMVSEMYPNGAKVAILRGVQGQTNDEERYSGFLDKVGNIDLVSEQHANWETDKGYTAVQNIIQANPDLEVVYCENDLMGIGAYQAIDEANLTDQVKIFSYDGVMEGLQYVKDGKFECTCAQQPIEMGKLGIANLAKVFAGEKAEEYIDTGCTLITKENVDETIKNTKQYTEEIK